MGNNYINTVSKIYEAFSKGDIPTIISFLADDVEWENWQNNSAQSFGLPHMIAYHGKENVHKFFEEVGKMNIKDFRVLSLMGNENQIAAEISLEIEMPTGAVLKDEEIHLWTFNDSGKVIRLRHYIDTAKHINAFKAAAVGG